MSIESVVKKQCFQPTKNQVTASRDLISFRRLMNKSMQRYGKRANRKQSWVEETGLLRADIQQEASKFAAKQTGASMTSNADDTAKQVVL